MLAYNCEQCKKITVGGYLNEFGEHFCCEKCYKLYCDIHGYTADITKLEKIKLPF